MIEWFLNLATEYQIAVLFAVISVVGKVSLAVAKLYRKKHKTHSSKYEINQTAYDNSTQIGIQIQRKKESK